MTEEGIKKFATILGWLIGIAIGALAAIIVLGVMAQTAISIWSRILTGG